MSSFVWQKLFTGSWEEDVDSIRRLSEAMSKMFEVTDEKKLWGIQVRPFWDALVYDSSHLKQYRISEDTI